MTVKWDVEKTIRDVKRAANQGVFLGAESVLSTAISHILNDPKTGAVYTTFFFTRGRGPSRTVIPYGSRPPHQASAPGEAPASDTGRLVQSATTEHDTANLSASVTFRTKYARFLEYGTDRMEPRPYARVSLEEKRAEIEQDIKNRIAAALRSGNES